MHATTQAMLQAIAVANDSNTMRPAQCWNHIGPSVLAWRQAGKPDLEPATKTCTTRHHYEVRGTEFVCRHCSHVSTDYRPCRVCGGQISTACDSTVHDVCDSGSY
jgi:hypothetical protein